MTANPIAVYIPPEADRGNPIRDPAALVHAKDVARELAEADLIPPAFRGKPANVLMAVILAYRLGEDPLYVLQSMSVISGRPCWSAQFVIARANKAGIFRGPIRWRVEGEGEGLAVTAYATVAETGDEVAFTVTMEMARADGWAGRNTKYKTLPTLMLRYRAAVLLVRLHAPEVLAGYHEREELIDAGLGEPVATMARPVALELVEAEVVPDPSPPSLPEPAPGGAAASASGGDHPRATPQQGRAWRERLAAWREAAELPPLDPEVVADLCEALDRPRPSACTAEQQEMLLNWLEGAKGKARYEQIAAQRAEALAAARSLSVADRRRAAERAAVGTEPAKLTLIELQRLGQAALDLGIGVDGDGVAEGEDAWTDPGTPTGEELDAAIGDLELALSDEHVRAAAAEIGVLVDKGGNPMLHDCDEPQLRRYLAALRARVSS